MRKKRNTPSPSKDSVTAPPPVLCGARVLAYALADDTVTYVERNLNFVGGRLLGRVPRLVICQDLGDSEIMIIHCDDTWDLRGIFGGFNSVEEAKCRTERSYRGLLEKWVDTSVTEDEARAYLKRVYEGEECSFCGRLPIDTEQILGDSVRICDKCIDEFYEEIHADEKA